MKPLAIVSGAGTGLGQALVKRFESGNYTVVGIGRTQLETSTSEFINADMSEEHAVAEAITSIIEKHGPPKVVIHNTAELVISPFTESTLRDYQSCWRSMVQTAILLAQHTLQPMVRSGGGSFLVSGATASLRGGAKFSAFASAKFALRGLSQSLAREFQPAGLHICHIILDGIIDTPRSRTLHDLDPQKMMKPQDIAEVYWQLAHQPRSTWTHELDLRPSSEGF